MKFREFEHLGKQGKFYSELAEVVEIHTGSEKSAWLAERLISHGILNGYRVYSQSKDIKALQTLDRAFIDIQRTLTQDAMTSLAQERLSAELIWGEHSERLQQGEMKTDMDEERELLAYINGDGKKDCSIMSDLEDRSKTIRRAIKRTIAEIETSPMAKKSASKINEQGIAIVDAARFIWELSTNNEAPSKDLNPASKFGNFLADVLFVCENKGDPKSIFRAWVRELGK